jgi:hypothetical protein
MHTYAQENRTAATQAAMITGADHMQDAASVDFHHLSHLGRLAGEKTKLCAPPYQLLQVKSIDVKVGDVLEPGQAVLELTALAQEPSSTLELEPEPEPFDGMDRPDLDLGRAMPGGGTGSFRTRHQAAVAVLRTAVGKLRAPTETAGELDFKRRSLEDRVRVIFHALDSNGDGYLTQNSIVSLLVTWGVPYAEALHCFDIFDSRSAVGSIGRVSFQEFFDDWEPIWCFQLGRVDEAVRNFHLAQEEELEDEGCGDEQHVQQPLSTPMHGTLLRDQPGGVAVAWDAARAAQQETANLREQLEEARKALASIQLSARP